LGRCYGAQDWWPAETPFEVVVGAVLTQNTAWLNVEKAIVNLSSAGCLEVDAMLALADAELAALIRPAGYYNVKARRLKNVCAWLREVGGIDAARRWDTDELRRGLLSINGVGAETADDILVYAFERAVFVVDTYTQRLFVRFGLIPGELPYETLRQRVEREIAGTAGEYAEFHALIVHHAKQACRKNPCCAACGIQRACAFWLAKN
jgi:endonuclease-3 related protein